jgi:hypothetical protein
MNFLTVRDWKEMADGNEKRQHYYASREWALLREAIKERSGGTCERCRRVDGEQVHHLHYATLYRERLEDLQHVCRPCHAFLSGKSHDDPRCDGLVHVYLGGAATLDYVAGIDAEVGLKFHGESRQIINCCTATDVFFQKINNKEKYEACRKYVNNCLVRSDVFAAVINCAEDYELIVEITEAVNAEKPCLIIVSFSKTILRDEQERLLKPYWFACAAQRVQVKYAEPSEVRSVFKDSLVTYKSNHLSSR